MLYYGSPRHPTCFERTRRGAKRSPGASLIRLSLTQFAPWFPELNASYVVWRAISVRPDRDPVSLYVPVELVHGQRARRHVRGVGSDER